MQSSNLSGRTVVGSSRSKFNFQGCTHVFLLAPKAWGLLIFGCVLVTVILVLVVTLVLKGCNTQVPKLNKLVMFFFW